MHQGNLSQGMPIVKRTGNYTLFFALLALLGRADGTDLSGRLSLRWYQIAAASANEVSAPALRLRLNANNLFNTPLNFSLYYRGEKDLVGDHLTKSHLYDMRLNWRPATSGFGFDLGRLNTSFVGAYGILDGMALNYSRHEKWSSGFFYGAEPDLLTLEMKDDIRRAGYYFQVTPGNSYQGSASIIHQTFQDHIDRLYLFVDQDADLTRSLQFSQFAEIDLLNKEGEETKRTVRFTNLFADLRFAPSRAFNTTLSFISRKEFKYMASMSDLPDSLFSSVVSSSYGIRVNVRPLLNSRAYAGLRTGLRDDRTGFEKYLFIGLTQNGLMLRKLFLNLRFAKTLGWYSESSGWYASSEHPITASLRIQAAYQQSAFAVKDGSSKNIRHAADLVMMYNLASPLYFYLKFSHRWGDAPAENRLALEFSYNIRHYRKKRDLAY
jgi:hypothetical protein